MLDYYDAVLGLIPIALFGVTGVLFVGGLGLSTAVPLAAIVSVGLIGHALFVNAPVDEVRAEARARIEKTETDAASFEPAD